MMLRPFFTYYGGKHTACRAMLYPSPLHDTIIEPFAGSAGYSTRFHRRNILLYEVDEKVYGVWDYLIKVKESEIRSLPSKIEHVDDIKGPQEVKWLVGFWLNKGTVSPKLTPSKWMRTGKTKGSFWGSIVRGMIASQLKYIRHWRIINSSYIKCPNQTATWFVDPPYQSKAGRIYRHNRIDYDFLSDWCRLRKGQVIVCESKGADWLPFKKLKDRRSTPGKQKKSHITSEVIWCKTDRHTGFINFWSNQ